MTKDIGVDFLQKNSLIDTSYKSKKEWDKIKSTDTIGRYYQIENNGNYLMCLPYSLEHIHPLYLLIELTPNCQLMKNEKFDFGNIAKWHNYYNDFEKESDGFFSISAQGGFVAGQYYYNHLYLFKEVLPQDSIVKIPVLEYKILVKRNFFVRWKRSKMIMKYCLCRTRLLEGDMLTMNYELNKGKMIAIDGKYVVKYPHCAKKKVLIKYRYKNGKWESSNTKRIRKIEKYMKVSPPYRYL